MNRRMEGSPDGRRLLILREVRSADDQDVGPPEIAMVVNWSEELKARVPVD